MESRPIKNTKEEFEYIVDNSPLIPFRCEACLKYCNGGAFANKEHLKYIDESTIEKLIVNERKDNTKAMFLCDDCYNKIPEEVK